MRVRKQEFTKNIVKLNEKFELTTLEENASSCSWLLMH